MAANSKKSELVRINIFDTVFNFIEKYDPEIKNIRVYGILDEHNKCENPLFHGSDLLKYINNNNHNKRRYFKKLQETKEILFSQKLPDYKARCNLITEYGLIKLVGFCKNTAASIALSEFIRVLFDLLKKSDELKNEASLLHADRMANINIEKEIEEGKKINDGGVVYFIQNIETQNIKIGRTDNDLTKRLFTLQIGNDCSLVALTSYKCDSRVIEKQLHEKFADYHIRGEWYNINMDHIEEALLELE